MFSAVPFFPLQCITAEELKRQFHGQGNKQLSVMRTKLFSWTREAYKTLSLVLLKAISQISPPHHFPHLPCLESLQWSDARGLFWAEGHTTVKHAGKLKVIKAVSTQSS